MIDQMPFSGNNPYAAHIIPIESFPLHRHYEIELIYCLDGVINADINGEKVRLQKGEMLYIGSFVPHAFEAVSAKAAVAEFGHAFLQNDFSLFSQTGEEYKIYRDANSEAIHEMTALSKLLSDPTNTNNLDILGSLYKLGAAVLRSLEEKKRSSGKTAYHRISPALRLIHMDYSSPLTVEDACKATSLSAGNFCTLFKKATGTGFHEYLNAYRVKNAGYLLKQTEMTIDEISALSGFSDIKTFYRVFKNQTGTPPGKYRKS